MHIHNKRTSSNTSTASPSIASTIQMKLLSNFLISDHLKHSTNALSFSTYQALSGVPLDATAPTKSIQISASLLSSRICSIQINSNAALNHFTSLANAPVTGGKGNTRPKSKITVTSLTGSYSLQSTNEVFRGTDMIA